MEIKNALIKSTTLGINDHGVLDAWLYLDYGNSGQGFGGYCIGVRPEREIKEKNYNIASYFIWRVLETVGVSAWESLPGCYIRVKTDYMHVESIGNIVEDKWFTPKSEFETLD